jgi:hypothetical protein
MKRDKQILSFCEVFKWGISLLGILKAAAK